MLIIKINAVSILLQNLLVQTVLNLVIERQIPTYFLKNEYQGFVLILPTDRTLSIRLGTVATFYGQKRKNHEELSESSVQNEIIAKLYHSEAS